MVACTLFYLSMELIKIQDQNGQSVVSARELHDYLGYDKSQWARWYKKNIIENPFAIENTDWIGFDIMSNGNETKDFALTLDFAKRLAMLARTEKGEHLRVYFVECEKKLKQPKELSRKELALLVIQIEEEKERLEAQNKQLTHTVNVLTHVSKTYTTTEIAKELGLKSAKELNSILEDKKIQYKQNDTWVLYSKYSHLGYVDIKQEVLESGKVVYHRKWTQIGREFILNQF